MRFIQQFFIEGQYLGQVEREAVRVQEDVRAPASLIFICEVCGEVYAKAPVTNRSILGTDVTGQGVNLSKWQAHTGLCRKHPPTYMFAQVPGSLWRVWDKPFLEALPMPVLQWELERHLDAIERLENHES